MDWKIERWVKVYTRDTANWLSLSFMAQAVFMLLIRKVDRHGRLDLGKNGKRSTAILIGHRDRTDEITAAVDELIDFECVEITDNTLVIPNFVEAQETPTSGAERVRRHRERYDDVTSCNAEKRDVTNRVEEKREEKKEVIDLHNTYHDDSSHMDAHADLSAGEVGGLAEGSTSPAPEPEATKRVVVRKPLGVPKETIEAVYGLYPRKEGKKAGIAKLERILRDSSDPMATLREIAVAIKNYGLLCSREQREPSKIKHFSTFINNWTDYQEQNLAPAAPAVLAVAKASLMPDATPSTYHPPTQLFSVPPIEMSDEDRQNALQESRAILAKLSGKLRIS